jgi:spermidine synthase
MAASAKLQVPLLQLFSSWGAFLLFSMEPLIGRQLLPGYGGSFQVWTTCLMFFQAMLLLGYCYTRWIGPRLGHWHLALMLLPLAFLPLQAGAAPALAHPIGAVLHSLLLHVALPFWILATSGVMAQTWLARSELAERGDPYFLYAASNAGSLAGLLAYPFLIEPLIGLRAQAAAWTLGYLIYLGLAVAIAFTLRGAIAPSAAPRAESGGSSPTSARLTLLWLLLSAAPAILLMAVTNAIAMQVGSLAMFWVLPLGLYLLTFVLAFGRRSWLHFRGWVVLGSAALALPLLLTAAWRELAVQLLLVFWLPLLCHTELHARRPEPERLTSFYFVQSLGGCLGGAFVAVLAPMLFPALYELAIGILLCLAALLLAGGVRMRDAIAQSAPLRWLRTRESRPLRLASACLVAVAAAPLFVMGVSTLVAISRVDGRFAYRNFYGIYAIREGALAELGIPSAAQGGSTPVRALVHGRTLHGFELLVPDGSRSATGYYHESSPYGEVFAALPSPKVVGVMGLGAGSMAAHFQADDELVFFEIDPDNERIARDHFGYLEGCPARTRVVVGDARLELARDASSPDGHYDALMIDAFSGDGVPTHLMTVEAIEEYLDKLDPNGLLVFHISNRYYDLRPVLKAASNTLGLHGRFRDSRDRPLASYESPSIVYVLARRPEPLAPFAERGWTDPASAGIPDIRLWSDDYVNPLVPLLAKLNESRSGG